MLYTDITPNWYDYEDLYARRVREARDGAVFVEVGSFLGRSTAHLGQLIRDSGKVIKALAVDPWIGSPNDHQVLRDIIAQNGGDLSAAFKRNMEACGVAKYVTPVQLHSVDAALKLNDNTVDFVFIDGDHSVEAVRADLAAWWPKVKPGGWLGGHDLPEPGPLAASDEFSRKMHLPRRECNRSFMFRKPYPDDFRAKVMLGLPSYGALNPRMARTAMLESTSGRHDVTVETHETSLLANGFNHLWCHALIGGYTHFAMLHSDIVPQLYWLDLAIEEQLDAGVDILGAVSPLKDARGVTSLGIANPGDSMWWSPKKRFTMTEIMQYPETFTAADAGYPDHGLLLNTACWVADLRNPLWRSQDKDGNFKVYFTIRDRVWQEGATVTYGVQSEDWFFSQRLYEAGLRAAATRCVRLSHLGEFQYPNNTRWGLWPEDHATAPLWKPSPDPSSCQTCAC